MKKFLWIFSIATLASVVASPVTRAEHASSRMIEDAIETGADQIVMPTVAGGMITVRVCDTCQTQVLRLANSFLARVDGRVVTLSEVATKLRTLGTQTVTVHFGVDDHLVTRISGPGL